MIFYFYFYNNPYIKPKINKEMIAQRHSLKPKTNSNFRVLPGLIINTIIQLNFLFVFFLIQQ